MSRTVAAVIKHLPFGPLHRLHRGTKQPRQSQEKILRRYLQKAQDTEYGLKYDFAGILAAADLISAYQAKVPTHNYAALKEDLERVHQGEPDVIWPGAFRYFTRSAGTTSAGKVFPVSPELLKGDVDLGVAMVMNYIAQTGDVKAVQGKVLSLCGVVTDDPYVIGARFGDISSLIADYQFQKTEGRGKKTPKWQALPRDVQMIPEMEARMTAIVESTMDADVRLVATMPPWMLVLFERLIRAYNEKHGKNVKTVGEIWPNLRLLSCGGVALQTYRNLLDQIVGLPDVNYLESYGASEGFFAFQNDLQDPALLLHTNCGIFFEFVPLEELNSANPHRFTVDQVEPGVQYVPHITTPSGLWSYCVNDVIRFTSVQPPKIIVCGRTGEMLQDYSEYVVGEDIQAAVEAACKNTGAQVAEYHVCGRPVTVEPKGPHMHTWILEFETLPDCLSEFMQAIDQDLQQRSNTYQLCRTGKGLGFPEAFVIPRGTFHQYLRAERGYLDAQSKVPRLREDREIAEGVLRFAGKDSASPDASPLVMKSH